LRRRGVNPWFDEEHLVGGQDWQIEIPKALATSDAIIICLTKNSVDKEGYIQKEIKFALDKALEMPEGRIFLIPVKFEECEVPFSLSRYQWVDLTVESGYSKMMKALKFRASQLERSTVDLSKKTVEEENLAIEKAAKEKAVREAEEKIALEKAEQEITEKARLEAEELARQKTVKEKAEREVAERVARNKAEREASKKAAPKIVSVEEKQANILIPKVDKPEAKKNKGAKKSLILYIIIFLGIIALAGFSINLFAQKIFTPQQTATQTAPNPTAVARTAAAEITLTAAAFTATLLPPTDTPFTIPTNTFTSTPDRLQSLSGQCDDVSFDLSTVDITIPDGTVMNRGEVFLKTWKIRNNGSCTWGDGYGLVYSGYADKMSGQPQPLIGLVTPGQEVEVSVRFTAPTQVGEYTSAWQIANSNGTPFGKAFFVKIIIK
jgi:hypothetical protein